MGTEAISIVESIVEYIIYTIFFFVPIIIFYLGRLIDNSRIRSLAQTIGVIAISYINYILIAILLMLIQYEIAEYAYNNCRESSCSKTFYSLFEYTTMHWYVVFVIGATLISQLLLMRFLNGRGHLTSGSSPATPARDAQMRAR